MESDAVRILQCPQYVPATNGMFVWESTVSLLLYLDDIIVFSSSIEQHLEQLEVVLGQFEWEGLKARLEKCAFLQPEFSYLGHVISAKGMSTDLSKVLAVSQWRRPSSATELHSFLGFASYHRWFVEGFAKIAASLHSLAAEFSSGKVKSQRHAESGFADAWSEQCEDSFEELKVRLTTAPVLAYADFSQPFILEVDTSYGGAMCSPLSRTEGPSAPYCICKSQSEAHCAQYVQL